MFIYSVVKTQIPAPPPGGAGIFFVSLVKFELEIETIRWIVSAASSKTGGFLNFAKQNANESPAGHHVVADCTGSRRLFYSKILSALLFASPVPFTYLSRPLCSAEFSFRGAPV